MTAVAPRTSRVATAISGTSLRKKTIRFAEQIVFYAAVLALWQASIQLGWISSFYVPEPTRIASALWRLTVSGAVFSQAGVTLLETMLGLVIGIAAGVAVGVALVRYEHVGRLVNPLAYFAYSLPRIALAPLFIAVFGLGINSKIATVIFAVFFVLLINTVAGARSVSADYVQGIRNLGASERQVLWKVIIPGTLAWIFSGIRLSVSIAFLSAVVAEFVGATHGLGYELQTATTYFQNDQVFAWLIVLGVLAMLINLIIGSVERWLLRWRPNQQQS